VKAGRPGDDACAGPGSREDTRLTDPHKPGLLMSLTALAIAWAGRTAADKPGTHAPPRKSHGHDAKTFFRIGFDQLRNRPGTAPLDAIRPWRRITRKRQKVTGAVSCVKRWFLIRLTQPGAPARAT
jgi:hypothetical protein